MRFDVLTLFPEIFSGYVGQSLLKPAIARGLVDVRLHDIRDWAEGKHRHVDDRPFGGGPGMVLMPKPVVECVEAVRAQAADPGTLVMLTPSGRRLTQSVVEELAGRKRLLLLCGRYEGFDERIKQILHPEEISVGDYVLNGGEVAAMTIIDCVIRLIPGVVGNERSVELDSFSTGDRLLEHEQYTRPREFRGLTVPEVLLSGDHGAIARWRDLRSRERTAERRPDILPSPPPATGKPAERKPTQDKPAQRKPSVGKPEPNDPNRTA